MEQVNRIKSYIGNVMWSESDKRDQLSNGPDFIGCKHGNAILYKEKGVIKSIDASLPSFPEIVILAPEE